MMRNMPDQIDEVSSDQTEYAFIVRWEVLYTSDQNQLLHRPKIEMNVD